MIEDLVLQALAPASIQLSLEASENNEADRKRLEAHHQRSVDRATYDAELERRRYESVDPDNRLVAAELERQWEEKLVVQRECEAALNRFRDELPTALSQQKKDEIEALSSDFCSLWNSDQTCGTDRQNLVRILIEKIVVEVVSTLNQEGFEPARQSRFTLTNINALFLTLRRKAMIGVSDGEKRTLPAGTIAFLEESGSKGHSTRVVGDEDSIVMVTEVN